MRKLGLFLIKRHGLFVILVIVIASLCACDCPIKLCLSSVYGGSQEAEKNIQDRDGSCVVDTRAQLCWHRRNHQIVTAQPYEDLFKEYNTKLESAENKLTLWATVMTVVFLVFSVLGLLKIDEKIKEAKQKSDEIDSKNKGIFSTLALILLAGKVSGDYPPFIVSTSQYLASKEECKDSVSRSETLQFFLHCEGARSLERDGKLKSALSMYDEIVSNKNFESQDPLLKALVYLRRANVYKMMGEERRKESDQKEDFKKALLDFNCGKELSWDKRSRAFFCVEAGRMHLELSRLACVGGTEFEKAKACFDEAREIYPQTHCIYILLGEYWRIKWNNGQSGNIADCDNAIDAFKSAVSSIKNLSGDNRINGDLKYMLKKAHRRLNKLFKQKKSSRESKES